MKLTFLTESGPQVLDAQQGQTLFQVLLTDCAIHMSAPCGGQGTCQKCTVYLQKETGEEAVLACRTLAEDGMVVRLPARETLEVATAENVDPSHILPDPELRGYGIACDIGTTTVVCHLLDLSTGQRLGTRGEGNAQRVLGGDVISRIKAASDGHLEQLQSTIIHQLSCMIQSLCVGAAICPDQISRMSVAANTTMCHLLTGLSPESIGVAPFTPLSLFGNCIDAKSLGLPFSGEVYIAPAISGYVGGDITAGMLAAGLDNAATPVLFIDVGTNGEMVLGCGDHFVCCSTAAGPAFEGAQIRYGMINMEKLDFLPAVRDMCAADLCHLYGRCWTCPPHCGTLQEAAAKASTYHRGLLVQSTGCLEDDFDIDSISETEQLQKDRFMQLVTALRVNDPNCLPMSSGGCTMCDICTCPDAPCRFPDLAIPSMEAYGLLVSQVCADSGLNYYYGPRTITFTACILID